MRYQADGQAFEGYYLAAADKQAPLVVLVHDWDGLNDYEIKRAEMLVALGYSVFAVDLFGAGIRPTAMEEKKKLTGALYQDRAKMRKLLQAGLAEAGKQGGRLDNAVALGYCFGGAAVLELARSGASLKGVVSVHGGLETPAGQDYKQTRASLLIQHGSADQARTATEQNDNTWPRQPNSTTPPPSSDASPNSRTTEPWQYCHRNHREMRTA